MPTCTKCGCDKGENEFPLEKWERRKKCRACRIAENNARPSQQLRLAKRRKGTSPKVDWNAVWSMYVRSGFRSSCIPFIRVIGIEPMEFAAYAILLNRRAFDTLRHLYESRFYKNAEKAKLFNEFERENRSAYYKAKLATPDGLLAKRKQSAETFQRTKRRIYQYRSERRRTDPNYRLACNLRTYIFQRVGRKNNSEQSRFRELVGCSTDEFRRHLESHFEPFMSWDNYGRGPGKWNIDHTVPCAAFDLSDPNQQRDCFRFTNLKPMWATVNLSKSDRLADGRRARHTQKV